MMTKIKKIALGLSLFGLLAVPALGGVPLSTVSAQADIQNSLCGGADSLSFTGSADCAGLADGASTTVDSIITTIVNVLSVIIGVIAVIMIIIGGLKYITSSGDSGNVTAAKNTILYAIVGLIIVALAQLIVRFVLGKVAGEAV